LRKCGSFRIRQGLDNEGEPCPQDSMAGPVSDIDHELAAISTRETISGHVGQRFDGLLPRLLEVAKDNALAVRNGAVVVVGVKVEAGHTNKHQGPPFVAYHEKIQRSRNYVSGF
jgi:hypothetical protein